MDELGYYPQYPNDEMGPAQTTIDLEGKKSETILLFKIKIYIYLKSNINLIT